MAPGQRRWLLGRLLVLGRFQAHSTSLISGLLFIALGAFFLAFDGTTGLSGVWVSPTSRAPHRNG
ncbi:hypothetical protein [Plantactinospora sp. GCM10030261]|uniref:hypothetical protein n=1 Tax=Plantactinospora sp. GCM10030261 TaxID=3273420 RepID=UPI00361D69C7